MAQLPSLHPMLQTFISQACYRYGLEYAQSQQGGLPAEVVPGWGNPHSSDVTAAGHQVGPLFGTFGV